MIRPDDLDQLYFLSKPVIGKSIDEKVLAFVFLECLFVLEYNVDNESLHSFGFKAQRISTDLSGSDFEVDNVFVTDSYIAIVSDVIVRLI